MSRALARLFPQALRAPNARFFSSGSGRVLVVADHDNSTLNAATLSVITAATKLGGSVSVLVQGNGCGDVAAQAAKVSGVTNVLHVDAAPLEHHVAENVSAMLHNLQKATPFDHILASTSSLGKSAIPRLGALLDVNPVSDVIDIKSESTFVRPIYAGNAIATVESTDATKLLTIRPTSFEAAPEGGNASVETASVESPSSSTEWVKDELSKSDRPELASAKVVVSGGRGMQNQENFGMLENLADKLGGAVGASRAAVDAGYAPNDMQVGQTGKVVAPELYMAFGISGAIQHLAGMKDSKTIVAVNKDPEAAIFQVADYGLVDDLFKVVPELQEQL